MLSLQINFKFLKSSKFVQHQVPQENIKSCLPQTVRGRETDNIVPVTVMVHPTISRQKVDNSARHSDSNEHPASFLPEWIVGFWKERFRNCYGLVSLQDLDLLWNLQRCGVWYLVVHHWWPFLLILHCNHGPFYHLSAWPANKCKHFHLNTLDF